jgi:hypothetical protein
VRPFDPVIDDWDDPRWDVRYEEQARRWPGGELAAVMIRQRRERQELAAVHEAERVAVRGEADV